MAGLSLLNLENKSRQQPKIAHEQGAGSQCTRCGPKCSGFDLHYWRKVCRNCRCGKENHLVTEEEDPSCRVGQLLMPSNPDVGQQGPASPLDWVPPTTDANLAVRYMEQMPVAQQPITGSQAAADRKRALDRQLPSHDLDPDRCQSLTAVDKRKMEEYVKNLKQFVVGQGLIQECPKLPAPPPQLHKILEEKVGAMSLQPSRNFVTPKPYVRPADSTAEQIRRMSTRPHAGLADDFSDLPPPPPELLVTSSSPTQHPPTPPPPPMEQLVHAIPAEVREDKRVDPVRDFFDFLDEQEGKKLPGRIKSPFLQQQGRSSSSSSPGTSPNMNQQRVNKLSPTSGTLPVAPKSRGSSPRLEETKPIPTNQRRLLTTDFDYVPENNNAVPVKPTSHSINNNVSPLPDRRPQEQQKTAELPFGYKQEVIPTAPIGYQQEVIQQPDQVWVCSGCVKPVEAGSVAIFAERAGSDKCWHPQCFTCSICHEMLADLIYFFSEGSVFCGRHFAEKMNIPRCKACDELIFATEYTSAEEATWHTNHFCCWLCDTPLAGCQYTPIDGQPHCLDCYQKKYGKDCYECGLPIQAGETRVGHADMNWHNTAACFKCRQCNAAMLNRQFVLKHGNIYCSRECVLQHAQSVAKAGPVLV